jgi:chaperonin GroES
MRRDVLAAGARSAKFAGGVGENDITRNIMSDEDRAALDAQTAEVVIEKAEKPKKVFRPLAATLLVRRVTAEELSSLVITETMEQEKPSEGTIIAVGPKSYLSEGDHVVFGKYAGTEFKLNGEVLLIMDQEDIKGTIEVEVPTVVRPSRFDDVSNPTWDENIGGCIGRG